jgi:protein-disulfide isomerase
MNTRRVVFWLCFVIVIGLIVWGMIAAFNKEASLGVLASPGEITATDHIRGPENAPVTLIEYSDFQCSACATYFPVIEQLLEEASTTVRFAYRHYPLPQHGNALLASQASEAAGEQGKFWEMYHFIFTNQKIWETSGEARSIFDGYARDLSLDMTRFAVDIESKEVNDKILNDLRGGQAIGVNATPTFFVNGEAVQIPPSYESFKAIIDAAVAATAN